MCLECFVRACSLTLAPLRGGLHGRRNCGIGIELLKHEALIAELTVENQKLKVLLKGRR